MIKRKLFFVFIFCFCLFGTAIPPAEADTANIRLSVQEGFDGKVKMGKGFPVQITLENNGEDFSGDLLFHYSPSYNSSGAKVIAVDLPKGSKKNYSITLPGSTEEFYNNGPVKQQTIFLYNGSWRDDHEESFIGQKTLNPKFIDPGSSTLGILSEDPDRLKELKALPVDFLETIILKDSAIPKDELGLQALDFLLVDEFAVSKLTKSQQEAIIGWVKNGGRLIVGGAPNAALTYGSLYKILPMKTDQEDLLDSKFLAVKPDAAKSFQQLQVFTGELTGDAKAAVKSGEKPVVVHREYGMGQIWQTAFSLGDEPLSSWQGYGRWFSGMFMQTNPAQVQYAKGYQNTYEMLFNEFADANEYFSSSQFSIGEISLLLFIYLLLIAPLLYLLLKKLDKREHAWWVILAAAVISTAGIFAAGAKDRIAKPQLNQMGIFSASGSSLNGYGAVTIMSNTSGNYDLTFSNGQFSGAPVSNSFNQNEGKRLAVEEEGRKGVIFPNVEYWSTRTYFGQASAEKAGQFDIQLAFEGKRLKGKITNRYQYDFDNLVIWSGNEKINLGPLKKGETISVDKTVQTDYLTSPNSTGNAFPVPNNQLDISKLKKEKMEYSAVEYLYNNSQAEDLPILFGYTKDPVIKVDINGRNESKTTLSLIYQAIDIDMNFSGTFTIKNDIFKSHFNVVRGTIFNENGPGNQVELDEGEYDYVLELPKQISGEKAVYHELEVSTQGGTVAYSLLNQNSGEFMPLKDAKSSFKENLGQFISKDGTITIKMIKSGKGDPAVILPGVTVKGEMH